MHACSATSGSCGSSVHVRGRVSAQAYGQNTPPPRSPARNLKAVLLVGFMLEEVDSFRALMNDMEADMVKVGRGEIVLANS